MLPSVSLLVVASLQGPLTPEARDVASEDAAFEPRTELWVAPRPLPTPASSLTTFSSSISCNSAPDADGPSELAFLPDGSAVVVAHRETDNLTFIDVNTRTVTHTVDVGDFPVHVAVTPNGQYAVAACVLANAVCVVDIATHTLVATIPTSAPQPYRVAITSDSQWAVVGVINDAVSSSFSVIDLTTLTQSAVIPSSSQGVIGGYFTPESGINGPLFTKFALASDDRTIVLPDRANARVNVYDRAGILPPATVITAANPAAVDISNDATTAVVSHEFGTRAISKLDLPTRTLSNSFTTSTDLSEQVIRITPDKSHAIAAISNNVIFVNLTSGAQAAQISTGIVGDIELTFDGAYAFVSNFNSSVIDVNTRTLVRTLSLAPTVETAMNPVARRAVALNSRFREDVHFYDVNGASGFVEGFTSSGAAPEGDASRSIAVSSDGRVAVVGNNVSRNATIVDLVTGAPRAWVDTGDRPLGVAITPDNAYAVVCNADSDTVSVVDLATDTRVANLPVPQRPVEVRISPDSQTAYVTTVAGTDRLYFLHLAGAASNVISSVAIGQMGSANGYAYTGVSGIELSPDGSLLGVCISFDDQLVIVDTATRTEIARVLVGDFPYQVAFTPDNARAYVLNSFGDSVSVVDVAGASTIATIGGLDFPSTIDIDETGSFVYVTNVGTGPALRVINAATNAIVANVSLAGRFVRSAHLSSFDHVLYLAAGTNTGGDLVRVSANGATSTVLDVTPLAASPAEMGFSEPLRSAVIAQPIPDGLDVRRFDLTNTYCVAGANSINPNGAQIGYAGPTSVSLNSFTLTVSGATAGPGFFYYGTTTDFAPLGDGFLCLNGSVFRLGPAVPSIGGANSRFLDFTTFPAGIGPGTITPGSTWYFQYRYRNINGPLMTGFNQSNGLQVTFAP